MTAKSPHLAMGHSGGGEAAGDHQALDLVGALEDLHDFRVSASIGL
jgi:hypothetical protein